MKRVFFTFMITVSLLAFTACNKSASNNDQDSTEDASTTTENGESTEEEAASEPAVTGTLLNIQGKWQSVDDENNIIVINGANWIEIYDGDTLEKANMVAYTQCAESGGQADVNGKYLNLSIGEDALCYSVDEVTESDFTITYLPKGKILKWAKVTE